MQVRHEWSNALCEALDRYSNDEIKFGEALDKIAERLVEQALEGDKFAITEIGNRLDGKPKEHRESVVHQTPETIAVEATAAWIADTFDD